MAKRTISNRSVQALRCPANRDRVFLWDNALSGFGVAAYAPTLQNPEGKKVYVAQFRLHGRSRRMAIGEHGRITPDEARSSAKKILGGVEDGKDPIDERRKERAVRSFKEVADEFIELHAKAKRKPRTAKEYESLLRLYVLPAFGSRRIVDVRSADVARLHARLAATPGAANRCLAVISSLWNWAARRGEVVSAANPARDIERYPESRHEKFLTSDEIAQLGHTLHLAETIGIPWTVDENKPNAKHIAKKNRRTLIDCHATAAIRLLILTGARLREILDARWDWIDWERGLLLLPDSKTGKKTIYLPTSALAILENLPRIEENPHIVAGRGPRKTTGTPAPKRAEGASRADLKRPWTAVSTHAGLEGVRLHDLRHSFASIGAGASLGLPIIGKLLGHIQPATTARYSHLDADPMRRAANLIGGQIAAALERNKGKEVIELRSC